MYLLLRRKPHTLVQFAVGTPPAEFALGEDHYKRLPRPFITATWRVDAKGYPVALFCRLVHGECWPTGFATLPRLDLQGNALTFWLTTERDFPPHDVLCDEVLLYRAGPSHFAWAFSLTGVSPPSGMRPIRWPQPHF